MLRITNATGEPARLELTTTALLTLNEVHSMDEPPPDVLSPRVGEVEISAPPGSSFSLVLTTVEPRHGLAWSLVHGQRSCRVDLREVDLLPGSRSRFSGHCQRLADVDRTGGLLEISISVADPPASGTGALPDMPAALGARLEALGYVD